MIRLDDECRHIAAAAYLGYCEVSDFKDADGQRMPRFEELPDQVKRAWDAAITNSLQEWLDTNFRQSIADEDFINRNFWAQIYVGSERNTPPTLIAGICLSACVMELIDPTAAKRYNAMKGGC